MQRVPPGTSQQPSDAKPKNGNTTPFDLGELPWIIGHDTTLNIYLKPSAFKTIYRVARLFKE